MKKLLCLFLLIALALNAQTILDSIGLATFASRGIDYFVSSTGSDSNPGSAASPFLTLGKAQTVVRTKLATQSTDANIHIVGTLPVTTTLSMSNADSGQNGFHLNIIGGNLGSAVGAIGGTLSAGTPITGWTQWLASASPIYRVSYSGANMRSIWVNGERCVRSRALGALNGLTLTGTGYTGATGTFLATDNNPTNIEFIYDIFTFSESRNAVTGIAGNAVTMLAPAHGIITGALTLDGVLADVENVWGYFTNNDTQGTFYYDQNASFIYYIPRGLENLSTASIIAPNGLTSAITMNGCTNVNICSLQFNYTSWDIHTNGFASVSQSQYYPPSVTSNSVAGNSFIGLAPVPAALYLSACTNCNVTNCYIFSCDTTGQTRTMGCNKCNSVGNKLYDMAFNAMVLGEQAEGPIGHYSTNCNTSENYIGETGMLALSSCGICSPFRSGSAIDHNYITEIPYIGIASGLGLDDETNWQATMNGNSILYNKLVNTMLYKIDGGAIYTQSPTSFGVGAGQIICSNYISRTQRYAAAIGGVTYPATGIYLDEGSMGNTVFSNVIDNVNFALYFNNLVTPNTCLVNFADTSAVSSTKPDTYTAPTVSASPSTDQPGIVAAAGLQGAYTNLMTVPATAWNALITSLSPTAWYRNDDTTTTLADYSGNSYNGTLTGGYTQSQAAIVPGVSRNTTLYNGTSGQAVTTTTTPINFGGIKPFSVIAIVSPNFGRSTFNGFDITGNDLTVATTAFPGWQVGAFFNYTFIVPNNNSCIFFEIVNNNATPQIIDINGMTDLSNSMPYITVFTSSGNGRASGMHMYLNGREELPAETVDNLAGTSGSSTQPLTVGSQGGTQSFFAGTMGDVIIVPYEMTPDAVRNVSFTALHLAY